MGIVENHQEFFKKLCAVGKWRDADVRRELGAQTEKLSQVWSKEVRREIFAKYTPVFANLNETVESQAHAS